MTWEYEKENKTLYRSRDGMILGVCKGIGEYLDFSVFWVRVIAVVALISTVFWPVTGLYFLAALLMKPEPVLPLKTDADEEFYHSYSTSRSMALRRLKRTFDNIDRRIRRMESIVTARDYDWENRFNE